MRIGSLFCSVILLVMFSSCRFGNDNGMKPVFPFFLVSEKSSEKPEEDDGSAEISGMITALFDAYNGGDRDAVSSALAKYFDKGKIEKVYGTAVPALNRITVNDSVIYSESDDLREINFELCDYNVRIDSEKAVVSGYVTGSAAIPGKGISHGPWKMTAGMFRYSGGWYAAYIRLASFRVIDLQYYLQLPDGYEKYKDRKWPLIVFLHGAGERGGSLDGLKQMGHSVPEIAATRKNFPFVVVSPLCPAVFSWSDIPFSVDSVINEVVEKYNIDTDRIYLTGLSLGGIGTWSIALQFPDRFAAIAPVCGTIDPGKAERLINLPIWAFHGAKDTIIPMDMELDAVNRLKASGGDIKYTVYADVGHPAWEKAYPGSKLYKWFLRHSLAKKRNKRHK